MTEHETVAREIVMGAKVSTAEDYQELIAMIAAAIKEAVEAETERCAKVADTIVNRTGAHSMAKNVAFGIAQLIRSLDGQT